MFKFLNRTPKKPTSSGIVLKHTAPEYKFQQKDMSRSFFWQKKLDRIECKLKVYKQIIDNPLQYDLLILPTLPTRDIPLKSSNNAFILLQPKKDLPPTALYFADQITDVISISPITNFPIGHSLFTFIKALYPSAYNYKYSNIINLSEAQLEKATLTSGHLLPGNKNAIETYDMLQRLKKTTYQANHLIEFPTTQPISLSHSPLG